MVPHQRKNMIYEISSHEKPILRDYLLITQTAQLTDKGERGDLYWKRNTLCMCEGSVRLCLCVCKHGRVCVHVNRKTENRFREKVRAIKYQCDFSHLSDAFTLRSQETKTVSSNIHTISLSPSRAFGPFNSTRNTYSSKHLCPAPA